MKYKICNINLERSWRPSVSYYVWGIEEEDILFVGSLDECSAWVRLHEQEEMLRQRLLARLENKSDKP